MIERAQDIRDDLATLRDTVDDIEREAKTIYLLLGAIEDSTAALEDELNTAHEANE